LLERDTRELEEAQRRREAQQQARRSAASLGQLYRAAGVRYEHVTLENFELTGKRQRTALAQLKVYQKRLGEHLAAGNGLLLYGPAGTGKDHLVVALARQAILRHGYLVRYVSGPVLFRRLRQAIDERTDEWQVIARFVHAPLLVLSDPLPPAGQLTDYQAAVLYELIDRRSRQLHSTWATLNVSSAVEADQRLRPQIVDRLQDRALVVHCNWPSWRRPLKEAEV